ncbi:MAG: NADPH-dependent F420 reductase [Methanotrichaceae archaeon]
MKIAVVGGTGDCGRGFVLHWSQKHEVIVGSRKAEKAEACAEDVITRLSDCGLDAKVTGTDNGSAIEASDIVVLSVPYRFVESVTGGLKEHYSDQIVISPVVPMSRVEKHFEYTPPSQGSASLLVRELLPSTVKIVAAFHTISYAIFQDLDKVLTNDILICGDDEKAKKSVAVLVKEIKDLRPLDVGPLKVSAQIESLTPLLLNISRLNNMKNPGMKIVT